MPHLTEWKQTLGGAEKTPDPLFFGFKLSAGKSSAKREADLLA